MFTDNCSFAFRISETQCENRESDNIDVVAENLLVDCGATSHIISDRSKFLKFDDNFNPSNHTIQLADGSKQSGIVEGKGDARLSISDKFGKRHNILLRNALCIPSYKQNIFSVSSATESGATLNFTPSSTELKAGELIFDIKKNGRLYYLNNVTSQQSATHTAKMWHEILGHCNVKDVLKLESVVDGMQISDKSDFNCDVCAAGKMTQHRNREPDERATSSLELVHCDLAGPIDPIAREGHKYAISFVDDFSGINMIYLLKSKSDTLAATQKFLADSAPYGQVKRLRCDNGDEFT